MPGDFPIWSSKKPFPKALPPACELWNCWRSRGQASTISFAQLAR
jgi:hypothetical protein